MEVFCRDHSHLSVGDYVNTICQQWYKVLCLTQDNAVDLYSTDDGYWVTCKKPPLSPVQTIMGSCILQSNSTYYNDDTACNRNVKFLFQTHLTLPKGVKKNTKTRGGRHSHNTSYWLKLVQEEAAHSKFQF